MTSKLIFTLGTGQNHPTRYVSAGHALTTRFAAIAGRAFHDAAHPESPIESAYVLVTPESKERHLESLAMEWQAETNVPLHVVHVPTPSGEEGFWALFEAISGLVGDDDQLALDITHGFRSMPLIAILALAYLRAVHPDMRLAMLGYGLFKQPGEDAPYLDLSELATLLDWSAALMAFRGGNASEIARLMRELQAKAFKRLEKHAPRPRHIQAIAKELDELAISLQTFRFSQLADSAASLDKRLGEFAASAPDREAAKPFVEFVPPLQRMLAPFTSRTAEPTLIQPDIQWATLDWLFQCELYLPYLALLREALVSAAARRLGLYELAGADERNIKDAHHFADLIVGGVIQQRLRKDEGEVEVRPWEKGTDTFNLELGALDQRALRRRLQEGQDAEVFFAHFEQVRQLRNSLMHAGFSNDNASTQGTTVRTKVRQLHETARRVLLDAPQPSVRTD